MEGCWAFGLALGPTFGDACAPAAASQWVSKELRQEPSAPMSEESAEELHVVSDGSGTA